MWLNAIINLSLGFFGFVVGVAAWLSAFPGPRSDYRWLWWVGGIIGLIIGKAMADALTTASSSTGTRPQARPAAPVNAGHRSASIGHLGKIACELGATLHWDPKTETFSKEPSLNGLLTRKYRGDWKLG